MPWLAEGISLLRAQMFCNQPPGRLWDRTKPAIIPFSKARVISELGATSAMQGTGQGEHRRQRGSCLGAVLEPRATLPAFWGSYEASSVCTVE